LERLSEYLSKNTYPGRGICIGRSEDGTCAAVFYFIMGRSENSRNRVFTETPDGIRTEAFDPAKLSDPSLIIYAPVRVLDHRLIVTNGDQTDTIRDHLAAGRTFEEALRTRCFEPDGPNFTPRISGLVEFAKDSFAYRLSILKSADQGERCRRFFYEYEMPAPGTGHIIHTYAGDGNPIPSFVGEPVEVSIPGDLRAASETAWNGLNGDNKVSLFTRFVRLSDGAAQTRIVNKHI